MVTTMVYNHLTTACQAHTLHPDLSDIVAYDAETDKYCKMADRKLSNSNCIVLTGHACTLRVHNGYLVLKDNAQTVELWHARRKLSQVILCAHSGNLTVDALDWLRVEQVALIVLNEYGDLVLSNSEPVANVALRRKQYTSTNGLQISIQLVEQKTGQSLKGHHIKTLNQLRQVEGQIAADYFNKLAGVPIQWAKADSKIIPAHWQVITERTSLLAPNGNGRRATNPFHAALNYVYSLLTAQIKMSLYATGLDPACGFLHADKIHRDSLVYDIIELFREAVDNLVLDVFTSRVFTRGDFTPVSDGSVRLNQQLARYIVASCRVPQTTIQGGVDWLMQLL